MSMCLRSTASVRYFEREGQYTMTFSTPITKLWWVMYWWNRLCMACSWIRWASGEVEVTDHLCYHHSPVVLSIQDSVVLSRAP